MHKLLGQILNAHGGIDRWNKYEKVEATILIPESPRAETHEPGR